MLEKEDFFVVPLCRATKLAAAESLSPLKIAAAENFFRCCAFFALAWADSLAGDLDALFSSIVWDLSIRRDREDIFDGNFQVIL